jgi:dTDP-4-dehydrorhamnose 3,5-epimerase
MQSRDNNDMLFNPDNHNDLKVSETNIPGLYEIDLVVNGDNRGWFKENYQAAKLEALGLPHFEVVQNNFSYNVERGVTRGLHAEPWEKFISVANGSVFGAWVDLRQGPSFGRTLTLEINPGKAVFVPRGVANGYQTLEENVTYTYLVNEHWSPQAAYTS